MRYRGGRGGRGADGRVAGGAAQEERAGGSRGEAHAQVSRARADLKTTPHRFNPPPPVPKQNNLTNHCAAL